MRRLEGNSANDGEKTSMSDSQLTKETLLPCPFCDGACSFGTVRYSDKTIRVQKWTQDTFHFVSCEMCGTKNLGLVGFRSPELAAAHWNKRVSR
jgi:hypothetical protein